VIQRNLPAPAWLELKRLHHNLAENCVLGITANEDHTHEMVLNSLGIVTILKPVLGYKQCAEIAREGYRTGKSLHQIVVGERQLITQEKWDELFSFESLIDPDAQVGAGPDR
jgi:aspartate ammonia-lyase